MNNDLIASVELPHCQCQYDRAAEVANSCISGSHWKKIRQNWQAAFVFLLMIKWINCLKQH